MLIHTHDCPVIAKTRSELTITIEAIATLACFGRNELPPNANLVEPDVELNLVRAAQPTAAEYVMSTGFGFGGHDSALIFKRV